MKRCCLEEAMNTVDVRAVPAHDEEAALLRRVAERIARAFELLYRVYYGTVNSLGRGGANAQTRPAAIESCCS